MKILNAKRTITILNQIMKYELSGVVRYTHYSLMVSGRDRLSLNQFFQEQASESLLHAQQAGELVTGLDGHPSLEISIIEEYAREMIKTEEIHRIELKKMLKDYGD